MTKCYSVFLTILLLTGCASIEGYPDRSVDVEAELSSLIGYFQPEVIKNYNEKKNESEKRIYRDEVVHGRIRAINLQFNEFLKKISKESKSLDIGADSIVLLLSGAGAIVPATSTQAILAATSGAVTGIKSSIDEKVYYEKTISALISQMIATRKTILASIYMGLDLDTTKYPLMKALIDIEDYYQAGTLLGATTVIVKKAGVEKEKADQELKSLLIGTYEKDKAGDIIRAFWKPDGNINKDNEKKIKAWLNENKIIDTSITFFINAKHFNEARLKAIKDLNIQ